MEAKDTVMSNLADAITKHTDLPMGQAIAIEQAEISFKAGMREVVEWVEQNTSRMNTNMYGISLDGAAWQAKLKEWEAINFPVRAKP